MSDITSDWLFFFHDNFKLLPLCLLRYGIRSLWKYMLATFTYIYRVGGVWVNFWWVQGVHNHVILVVCEYPECTHGPSWPPNLWRYQLPGFSSPLSGLSLRFHPGNCLLFPCGEYRDWANTHRFFFTPAFYVSSIISVFLCSCFLLLVMISYYLVLH